MSATPAPFRFFAKANRAARPGLRAAMLCLAVATHVHARAQAADVVVKTLADAPLRGSLRAFSLADGLELTTSDDDELVTAPADEVVHILVNRLRAGAGPRSHAPAQRQRRQVEIQFVNGDRLFGEPVRHELDTPRAAREEIVRFETPVLGTLEIPLSSIDRWINLSASSALGAPDSALGTSSHSLPSDPESLEDRLVLSNGDVIHGLLLAIDDHAMTLEADGALMTVPHAQVAAIDLAAESPPARWESCLRASVTFVDGSRLTTGELAYGGGELRLSVFGDLRRTGGLNRVARIDVTGGRWVWITDLEPISVQHTPMLSLNWPYVKDANVLGRPMRIANRRFEHGLGVHSESSLMYDLAGKYDWLVTFIGIDDSASGAPGRGDVLAEIRVDGEVRYRQEHVSAGKLHGPLRISVRDAARIELRALFGENASIQDRFNWADAGLIRAAPTGREDPGRAPVTE